MVSQAPAVGQSAALTAQGRRVGPRTTVCVEDWYSELKVDHKQYSLRTISGRKSFPKTRVEMVPLGNVLPSHLILNFRVAHRDMPHKAWKTPHDRKHGQALRAKPADLEPQPHSFRCCKSKYLIPERPSPMVKSTWRSSEPRLVGEDFSRPIRAYFPLPCPHYSKS
jgi:hypothetical protein